MKKTSRSPPVTRMVVSATDASEPDGNSVRARAQCRGEVARLGGAQGADPAVQVVDLEHVELVRDAGLREHEIEGQIDRALSGHAKDLDVGDRNEVGALELHRGRVLVSADRQPRQGRDGRIGPRRRSAGPAHGTCDGARDERATEGCSKGSCSRARMIHAPADGEGETRAGGRREAFAHAECLSPELSVEETMLSKRRWTAAPTCQSAKRVLWLGSTRVTGTRSPCPAPGRSTANRGDRGSRRWGSA